MKVVGIRDLKDHLSRHLRYVRAHGPVYVSNRGEIVAELRESYGPGTHAGREVPEGLLRLAGQGLLRLGARNEPDLYPSLGRALSGVSARELLDAERE